VELTCEDVVLPDAGGKGHPVIREAGDKAGIFWAYIIRMDEVEVGSIRDSSERRGLLLDSEAVPAHMRDFERGSALGRKVHLKRESLHGPLEDIQAGCPAEFCAFGEKELKAEADAQIGLSLDDGLFDGGCQTQM
jgi:hypothetical protein